MLNKIKLLPESVANQIAAGEVIQRPASAVKELLENSIDSGATKISLIIKDAGKTLIQVTDNGSGMSDIDARMSFERHATSKITKAEDLFAIKTMGFRGEALASIAAIAQVELKTKTANDEIGTKIIIEGSSLISQEPCQLPTGTTFMIKNLFFNVPARRNFLKSNNVELRHINEELSRVAIINPDIEFNYYNNNKLVYKLIPGSLKSRIAALFGNSYNEKLLPIEETTDLVEITGFISKPEFSKKTRGEQYFFVNGRFIKHAYLHHAVNNAYTELIPSDAFPSYFIKINIKPQDIDINIHPTKTEVNFQDARYVYAVMHAAVKQSIGRHSLTPTIDFNVNPEVEAVFQSAPSSDIKQPAIKIDPDFNPFSRDTKNTQASSYKPDKQDTRNWESLYGLPDDKPLAVEKEIWDKKADENSEFTSGKLLQVHGKFIITNVKSGLLIIDQHLAHFRIKYEEILSRIKNTVKFSQQLLFPQEINLSDSDIELIISLKKELNSIGFIFDESTKNSILFTGVPTDMQDISLTEVIETIIENFKLNKNNLEFDRNINLARSIALKTSIKYGTKLDEREMQKIFDSLFMCSVPKVAPDGENILHIINISDLEDLFNKETST